MVVTGLFRIIRCARRMLQLGTVRRAQAQAHDSEPPKPSTTPVVRAPESERGRYLVIEGRAGAGIINCDCSISALPIDRIKLTNLLQSHRQAEMAAAAREPPPVETGLDVWIIQSDEGFESGSIEEREDVRLRLSIAPNRPPPRHRASLTELAWLEEALVSCGVTGPSD